MHRSGWRGSLVTWRAGEVAAVTCNDNVPQKKMELVGSERVNDRGRVEGFHQAKIQLLHVGGPAVGTFYYLPPPAYGVKSTLTASTCTTPHCYPYIRSADITTPTSGVPGPAALARTCIAARSRPAAASRWSPRSAHLTSHLPLPPLSKTAAMANHEHAVLAYPHKADMYTYRVPTPPRIVVPPPALNADAVPEIAISALRNSAYHFLQNVNYENIVQQNAPLEWAYERRREAQTILPFLCLGPMTAAKDEVWLRREGVTMLLGVRQKHSFESRLMNSALRAAEKLGIEHLTVDLASNQDLIQEFPNTTARINNHLTHIYQANASNPQLGKVLVFCESGNERSAGVVAAYLMEMHEDVDYIKAMQLCQAQRFCVNFDDGMKRLLQGYWDILCAKRTVAAQSDVATATTGAPGLAATPARTKRGLERAENGDQPMDMQVDHDDLERFGGRTFAPFVDQPL